MEHKFNIMVNRLAEIEQAFSDYKQKSEERFCNQMQKQEQLEQKIVELTDKYNTAVEKFNTAVEAVNALSEQVKELQANYDPTVVRQ